MADATTQAGSTFQSGMFIKRSVCSLWKVYQISSCVYNASHCHTERVCGFYIHVPSFNQPSIISWNEAEGDGATAIMAQYETARRLSLPGLNFENATGVVSPFNSTFGGSPTHADLKGLKMQRPFEISNQPSLFAASTISTANNGANGYNAASSPFSFSATRVVSGNGNGQRPATVAGSERGRLKTQLQVQLQSQSQSQQQLQLQLQGQQQRPGTSAPPGGSNRRLTFG